MEKPYLIKTIILGITHYHIVYHYSFEEAKEVVKEKIESEISMGNLDHSNNIFISNCTFDKDGKELI